MEAIQDQPPRKLHPVIWVAAVSVTLFSLVGIGAITGLIPISRSQPADQQTTVDQPAQRASMTQAPAEQAASSAPKAIEEHEQAAPAASKPVPLGQHELRKAEAPPGLHKATKPEPLRMARAPVEDREPQPPAAAPAPAAVPDPPPAICHECGVVSSVRTIERGGEGTGVGAVGGAVAGGVIGHQMGGGRGRDVMTVLGAIAGGVGGHEIEKRVRKVVKHEVTVRFDDGRTRTFNYDKAPMFRNGDHVRLAHGGLVFDRR